MTEQKITENAESVQQIIEDIYNLKNRAIAEDRREQIKSMLETTINGDISKFHVATTAKLSKDVSGILVYILTNLRLIKVDIDAHEIKSSSFSLDKIIGVERKLVDDRAEVRVSFENGSFGIKYNPSEKKLTDFFQKVDQHRSQV